jgi:hypothetical protein
MPQHTSLSEREEKSCWISLAWWRRLHDSVDVWQCVILEARLEVTSARVAWPSAFVYLEHAGKQRLWLAACTWGSSHWFGVVSPAMFWREACGRQKPPGIRHASFTLQCFLVRFIHWQSRLIMLLYLPISSYTKTLAVSVRVAQWRKWSAVTSGVSVSIPGRTRATVFWPA